MKPAHIALLALLALLGAAHAASYATVADAVKALPELSTLNTNLQGTNLTKSFGDPAFVGTVFLPTNDALTSLSDKVRDALTCAIQVFACAPSPSPCLSSAQLLAQLLDKASSLLQGPPPICAQKLPMQSAANPRPLGSCFRLVVTSAP
jgi:hypothetical protein